jgi:hypothetical protein
MRNTVYHQPGGCVQETTSYSESGVQIWNDPASPASPPRGEINRGHL